MKPDAPIETAKYDNVAILLHWTTAVLIVFQMAVAQLWDFTDHQSRDFLQAVHMSSGISLLAIIVFRIVWKTMIAKRRIRETAPNGLLPSLVHWSLYGLVVLEAGLGFVLRWSGHESMIFFGLELPPPFGPFSRPAHHLMGTLHSWTGWLIILVASGHAGVAIYRSVVLRDGLLRRMRFRPA